MGIALGTKPLKKAWLGSMPIKKICLGDVLLWPAERGLVYVGAITPLSVARRYMAAATVGGYALFGGGHTGSYSAVVDAYDQSLTRTTPTALRVARNNLAATTVRNYALFGGGYAGSPFAVVDAYTVQ